MDRDTHAGTSARRPTASSRQNLHGELPYCLGPTVPVSFNRDELTQPETVLPVFGFEYITDDQPSFDCAYTINSSLGITKMPSIAQPESGAE